MKLRKKWILYVVFIISTLYFTIYMIERSDDYQSVQELRSIIKLLKNYHTINGYFPTEEEFEKLFPDTEIKIDGFHYSDNTSGYAPSEFRIRYKMKRKRDFAIGETSYVMFYDGYYYVTACNVLSVCDPSEALQRRQSPSAFREQPWRP